MTYRKLIVVIGGTGRVGRSVAVSLLQNPNFRVRVTTRDLTSKKAQDLKLVGAEVIKADSWDTAELDQALKGAWGVFLNTNGDAPEYAGDGDLDETQMGKNVVDAAQRQGVQAFIYAGLPEVSKITHGTINIKTNFHKNNISDYARQAGFRTTVNVNVGWMMENFWNPAYEIAFGGFARLEDSEGYLTIHLFPMGNAPESTPFTSVRDDYGDIVHGVFLDPETWDKQTVWAVSQPLSFQGFADAYNRVSGTTKARYLERTAPNEASTPEKTAEINAIRKYVDFVKGNYCNGQPVDQAPARELKKFGAAARNAPEEQQKLQTVEGFIRQHGFRREDM
ncbi:hypothetical protein ACN38_g12508 [Penicillium nordicum]|uniref:NmrA-like domain-containing protein n=1 Tax=Penicillium nordicum TaxID=229535 RepID=A0A0M8NYE4_9EURO|nr:hypothetical protein ACN38_g12508 [Penicillium nordicum]